LRSGFTVPPWPRFPRPPCDPGWSDFPNPVLTLAVAHKTFPIAAEFKCSVHVQSATPPVCFVGWFTCEDRFTPGSVSENHPGTAKCPEPLCLKTVFRLSERCLSCTFSEGVTPPSSLLRAHAPRSIAFTNLWPNLVPVIFAGCYRPLLVNRSFPTLSLRVLPKMPGPLPRRFAGCTYLLLPLQHRPSPKELKVGVP